MTSQNTKPSRVTISPVSTAIGVAEHRAGAGEGVELAVLGARVDARRQVGQQAEIEAPAGEARGQLASGRRR